MASVLTAVDTQGQLMYSDPEGVVYKIAFRWFVPLVHTVPPRFCEYILVDIASVHLEKDRHINGTDLIRPGTSRRLMNIWRKSNSAPVWFR